MCIRDRRLFNRTPIRDLQKASSLFISDRPGQLDPALDHADADLFRLTILAVALMRLSGSKADRRAFERPTLAVRINTERHHRAASERCKEIFVGCRAQ